MKHFWFTLFGFCLYFSLLTLARQQLIAGVVFVALTVAALLLGYQRNEVSSMSSKPRAIPYPPPASEQVADPKPTVDRTPASAAPVVTIPDIFDEGRIRQDLARFAKAPGVFQKYVERARSRFNKVGERAILEQWIAYYETGRRLIESRTEMERRRSEWLQLTNEHELKNTQKDAEIAKLRADIEENNFRLDQAAYKRENLERFVEGGRPVPTEPQLTTEQRRAKERKECENRIAALKAEKLQALKLPDEEERMRKVIALDDALEREYERWAKLV